MSLPTPPGTRTAAGVAIHVVPVPVLAAVWALLILFTVLTVAAARINLGGMNLWTALAIALVKAALVALYFMHMRYDRPFHAVILFAALLMVTLFIGLALLDAAAYEPSLIRGYQPGMPGG